MIVVLIILVIGSYYFIKNDFSFKKPKANIQNSLGFSILFGDEELVEKAREWVRDSNFFYINGNIYFTRLEGNDISLYRQYQSSPSRVLVKKNILKKGDSGQFDTDFAQMTGMVKLKSGSYVGIYLGTNNSSQNKIGIATSTDMINWSKPNYPNNVIISPDPGVLEDRAKYDIYKVSTAFVQEGYLCVPFSVNWNMHIARSQINSDGTLGSFYKYYCSSSNNCGFTEKGLEGKSTGIKSPGELSYNEYLGKYLLINSYGKWGFKISATVSSDPSNWVKDSLVIYPEISSTSDSSSNNWSLMVNKQNHKSFYFDEARYHMAPGNSTNGSSLGKSFYIYYDKIYRNEGLDKVYTFRRKVTLQLPPSQDISLLSLNKYKYWNTNNYNYYTSTELSKELADMPRSSYSNTFIGYLSGNYQNNFSPVYECYVKSKGKYRLFVDQKNAVLSNNYSYCENSDEEFIRKAGYISNFKQNIWKKEIFECYNDKNGYYYDTIDKCGNDVSQLVGYVYDSKYTKPKNEFPSILYLMDGFKEEELRQIRSLGFNVVIYPKYIDFKTNTVDELENF